MQTCSDCTARQTDRQMDMTEGHYYSPDGTVVALEGAQTGAGRHLKLAQPQVRPALGCEDRERHTADSRQTADREAERQRDTNRDKNGT